MLSSSECRWERRQMHSWVMQVEFISFHGPVQYMCCCYVTVRRFRNRVRIVVPNSANRPVGVMSEHNVTFWSREITDENEPCMLLILGSRSLRTGPGSTVARIARWVRMAECLLCTVYRSCVLFLMEDLDMLNSRQNYWRPTASL